MKVAIGLGSTSGGFTLLGFITQAIPVLQAVSLLVAISSGVLGMCWMFYQYKRSKK